MGGRGGSYSSLNLAGGGVPQSYPGRGEGYSSPVLAGGVPVSWSPGQDWIPCPPGLGYPPPPPRPGLGYPTSPARTGLPPSLDWGTYFPCQDWGTPLERTWHQILGYPPPPGKDMGKNLGLGYPTSPQGVECQTN